MSQLCSRQGTQTRTGPRALTLDITPLAPPLTGTKYIAVWVDTYDLNGWYANVDFTFTADPLQASPKPPASGIIPLFFKMYVNADGQPSIDPVSVAIPPTATQVMLRLFSTGHGGVGSPPCDEFCHRNNQILIGGVPAWEHDVWRTDCIGFLADLVAQISRRGTSRECWALTVVLKRVTG